MKTYYNEIEPYAAQWLRNLIAGGYIAPGDVDERDIRDVRPDDLKGYVQCHFFAGLGGWSHALRLAGWPDDRHVWTGSCPCQPFSVAGKKRGFADNRHLRPEWFRLIRECGPATVFGEQVASAVDWLSLVRGDLESMGYIVGAMPIEAACAGAFHLRNRYWFVADARYDGRAARHKGHQYESGASIGQRFAGNDVGDSRSAGLAIGSLAEDGRGTIRHERPSSGTAGNGSGNLGFPNSDRCASGSATASSTRHGHSALAAD